MGLLGFGQIAQRLAKDFLDSISRFAPMTNIPMCMRQVDDSRH